MSAYYIVIDLEMNPLAEFLISPELKQETIEIGAVKIDAATNQIVDQFTCTVRPEFNYQIEPRITRLTGITTEEVSSAGVFSDALSDFVRWIGSSPAAIYSWSDTDLAQIRCECLAKHLPFPRELTQWTDFQAEYPKYIGCNPNKRLSLKKAARLIGTRVTSSQAHRALYDAQITASLVLFALTGAYKHFSCRLRDGEAPAEHSMTYSIGDSCGAKLSALLARLNQHEEREGTPYGGIIAGSTAALVR